MKITGLSRFHERALRKSLNSPDIDGEYELQFTGPISLNRLDSLWYGGSKVDVKHKGYIFHIEATGDVYADLYSVPGGLHFEYIKDKNNNGDFGAEMLSYFRSDKALYKALSGEHPRFRIEMQHNNWWECFVTAPDGQWHDLMWNLDSDGLFSAVCEAIGGFDEAIKNIEDNYSEKVLWA